MKKSFWVFTLILVVAVILVEFDVARRTAILTVAKTKKANVIATYKNLVQPAPASVSTEYTFEKKFVQLSKISANNLAQPEESEQKIQDLAKNLSSEELKHLADVMVDKKADEDQRTLAVQLVARNQTVESLKELESFVLHKKGYSFFNRKNELESVLKAQAIEGIAAFPQKDLAISSLTSLDPKLDESFLKDRIKRSMAILQNQVEKSEKTDTDALQKLVE